MSRRGPDVRFVTRKWPPAVGGMETYSEKLVDELGKRGSVDLIMLPGRESGEAPTPISLAAFGLRAAAGLLVRPEARVVHVADLASWPLAWIASLRHPRSRIIISVHGSDVSVAQRRGWRAALYRKYLQFGARLLTKAIVIANSPYIAGLAERAGFRRTCIVPLATDLDPPVAGPRAHLLYAGRISRPKGLRFVVEQVLPLLPPGTRLRVAGAVWDESERPLLSHPSVDYLGVLKREELATEYARAAAVLIPTRESEGFGLVAVEAAACGAFVIASNHSGLADVVHPPIGVTADADNPEQWSTAIGRTLGEPAGERSARAQQARDLVDRCYRWDRVADETWAIYEIG